MKARLLATLVAVAMSNDTCSAFHYFATPLVEVGKTKGPNGATFGRLQTDDYSIEGPYVAMIGSCGDESGVYRAGYNGVEAIATTKTLSPGRASAFTAFHKLSQLEGDIVFVASDSGTAGIFRWRNGSLSRLFDTTSYLPGTGYRADTIGDVHLGLGGNIAFKATSGFFMGMYYLDGAGLHRLVDLNDVMPGRAETFVDFSGPQWYGDIPMFAGHGGDSSFKTFANLGGMLLPVPDPLGETGELNSFVVEDNLFIWGHSTPSLNSVAKSYDLATAVVVAQTGTAALDEGVPLTAFTAHASDQGAVSFLGLSSSYFGSSFRDLYSDFGGALRHAFNGSRMHPPAPDIDLYYNEDGMNGRSLAVYAGAERLYRLEAVTSGAVPVPGDFDGDGKDDRILYDRDLPSWFIRRSGDGGTDVRPFGFAGTWDAAADYDGDHVTDMAVFHPASGMWYVFASTAGFFSRSFGYDGTLPCPADYDGDGTDDLAVFDPQTGTWFVMASTAGFSTAQFGFAGCVPIPADYDGDGKADVAVFDPASGTWFRLMTADGFEQRQFGYAGVTPLPRDYDHDGHADLGVYDPSTGQWFILASTDGFSSLQFGYAGAVGAPADYDGDGMADFGVFDTSSGAWYLLQSTAGFQAR